MDLFNEYSITELKKINIDFLGLAKQPWNFSRGAKTERLYNYPNGDVGAKVYYTYTYNNGNRGVDQPTRMLEFYNAAGEMKLQLDITKLLNIKQLSNLNRDLRQGRIDYLDSAAEQLVSLIPLVPEPYKTDFQKAADSLPLIHRYYKEEIESYIQDGTLTFENAIRNEANPIMVELMELKVRPPDALFAQGLTMRQSILHQLTGEYNP
jgi:hypothetical protein